MRAAAFVIAGIGLSSVVLLPPPAAADPGNDPCVLALSLVCRFMPIAPDLEDDIDLTAQQPITQSSPALPESTPTYNACTDTCIPVAGAAPGKGN